MTKQSLYSGPIFTNYFLNKNFLTSKRGLFLINEHMLKGWLANKDILKDSEIYPEIKQEFKRQWHLNHTYQELLKTIAPSFEAKKIHPVLLKGITFLEDIYTDLGDRSMSDIDMLITKDEIGETISILVENGFNVVSDKKWRANSHKVELIKDQDGIEIVIELHTSLLYHCEEPKWRFVPIEGEPYQKLAPEDLIFYQCTHLAFQHTFLKLFWFLDIHLLINKFDQLDEVRILELAKRHSLKNSTALTFFILKKYFNTPFKKVIEDEINNIPRWKKAILSISFLLDPKKNYPRYLMVKHLCRDSLRESLNYDLGWFKDRFL